MMDSEVFISYSTKDKPTADATCAVLEAAGIRCWIAPRDIRPGGEYGAAIIDAIDRSRATVLIFSSNANDSRQIHREIERAVSKGVPIVPVRIEEVAPTKSMEYFLGSIHWLDALTPPIEKHLGQLVETVKALLPADGQPGDPNRNVGLENTVRSMPTVRTMPTMPAARSEPAVRPLKPQRWTIPIVGGLAFVALLAATVWFLQGRSGTSASDVAATEAVQREPEALVPEVVPFIPDGERDAIRADYMTAPDYKAIAISSSRGAFITGQKDEATAKEAALTACQRTTNSARNCMLYAVGDTVVFTGGRPPLPPQPWFIRDTSIERPVVAKEIPLIRDLDREFFEQTYAGMPKPKAVAIARGQSIIYSRQASTDEAIRRSLEWCGFVAGTTCMIVAVDDMFVVPIPTTMKPIGLFRPTSTLAIASEAREDVERRLGIATGGWRAVAVGASGRPGLSLRAKNEQDAVNGALAECARQDHSCRVIAIGPFVVEPLLTASTAAPAQPPPPPKPERAIDKLAPEKIPYITSKERSMIRKAYLPAAGHKALAISSRSAYVVGQKDEETAKAAALAACQDVRDAGNFECELYAVGDSVVYASPAPPMPPEPWLVRNQAIERPFVAKDVPLIAESSRAWLEKRHPASRESKALALGQQGRYAFISSEATPEDAARRALEICGIKAGAACMTIAIDDVFIAPIPTTMKVNGFFRPGSISNLSEEARNEVERRLGNNARGWTAVAIGETGRPGVIVGAPSERVAIGSALADCGRKDRACRVIAIGPFSVEPLGR